MISKKMPPRYSQYQDGGQKKTTTTWENSALSLYRMEGEMSNEM